MRDIQSQISVQESNVQSTQSKLATVYDGLTSDKLREKLADAKYEATTESIKGRIVQDAIDLISRDESEDVPCPICDSHQNRQIFESALQSTANQSDNTISSVVTSLESRVQESEALENLLKNQKAHWHLLNDDAATAINRVGDEDKTKLAETNDIDQLIENYSEKESVVKVQLDDQKTWFMSQRGHLNRIKEESRFHRIQRRLNKPPSQ